MRCLVDGLFFLFVILLFILSFVCCLVKIFDMRLLAEEKVVIAYYDNTILDCMGEMTEPQK